MVEQRYEAFVHLRLLSASGIRRGWLSGDQTYVMAWVDPEAKKRTASEPGGGEAPQWHDELIIPFHHAKDFSDCKQLTIEIRSRGAFGDSLLGSVYVPVAELQSDGSKRIDTILTYQVSQPCGRRQGSLKFTAKVAPKSGDSGAPRMGDYYHGAADSSFDSYPPCFNSVLDQSVDEEIVSSSGPIVYPLVSPHPPADQQHNLHHLHDYPSQHYGNIHGVSPYPSFYPTVTYPSSTLNLAPPYPVPMYPYRSQHDPPYCSRYSY